MKKELVQMIVTIYKVQAYQVPIVNSRWPSKIQVDRHEIQFFWHFLIRRRWFPIIEIALFIIYSPFVWLEVLYSAFFLFFCLFCFCFSVLLFLLFIQYLRVFCLSFLYFFQIRVFDFEKQLAFWWRNSQVNGEKSNVQPFSSVFEVSWSIRY